MPGIPRKLLVVLTEVGVFHCIGRRVRPAVLCGVDPFTGRNFDRRMHWLKQRIAFLSGQFGIDRPGFAVMSNHGMTFGKAGRTSSPAGRTMAGIGSRPKSRNWRFSPVTPFV
jgi:hypothetical protein